MRTSAVPDPWWTRPYVVAAVATVLYAVSSTPNLALAHDAAGYLLTIERGSLATQFHPHHLLYAPTAAAWLGLLRRLTGAVSGAIGVALLNALAGGACVGLVARILAGSGVGPRMAAAAAAAAGSSFGLWFYSASVEVYVIPLAFLLGALLLAIGRPSPARAAWIGLLHGLAMVFHQIHVLFGVVILATLATWPRDQWRSMLGVYIGAGTAVVVVAYGWALTVIQPASMAEAWRWFTMYAQDGGYIHGLSMGTLAKAVVGAARSIVGGHFAFGLGPVQALLSGAFPDKILIDETFLVRRLPPLLLGGLIGASALAVACFGWLALHAKRQRAPGTVLRRALVAWITVYSIFFLFWDPFNLEFWIPQATALWMLVGLELRATGRRATAVLAGAAALLLAVNGIGTIGPARDSANDAFAQRLRPLDYSFSTGGLLVLSRDHILGPYAALSLGAETMGLAEATSTHGARYAADSAWARILRATAAGACVAVDEEALAPTDVTRQVAGPAVDSTAALLAARLHARPLWRSRNHLASYLLSPTCPRP